MNLTPAQKTAVEHRDSNLLLAASAGSGKTEVLARRCVALIGDKDKPCGVDRLLVVTFTRAAAAELRVRIARMLREASLKASDHTLRAHLRRQSILVDSADIGTIDSWCGRLVRAHFAEANVDAEFVILDEKDALLLRQEALGSLFEWIYVADDPLAAAGRSWIERHARANDDFLRHLILQLNTFREQLINAEQWWERQLALHGGPEEEIRAHAARLLADALAVECRFQHEQMKTICATWPAARDLEALRLYRDALAGWVDALRDPKQLLNVVKSFADFWPRKPRGLAGAPAALLEEVKKRWFEKRLKDRWEPTMIQTILDHAGETAKRVVTLLELEKRFYEKLLAAKQLRTACEFGDVLRLALNLLGRPAADERREPTEIARHLRQLYEHILVDEYQDTSPVQVEILRLVTRAEPGQSNRFMVGDIKQSIYGFREAEPRLFIDLMQAFAAKKQEGRVQYLADNFRSHGRLLAGLNALFAMLFDPLLGGSPYGEREKLQALREEILNPLFDAGPRIEVHLLEAEHGRPGAAEQSNQSGGPDSESDEDVLLEKIEREAILTADMIQAMRRANVQVPARDENNRLVLRPLRLSDIAILLRSAKFNAGLVARVFRERGLSCVTSGREAILESIEALDIRNVLSLLANRRQDVPLAAYLRGPLAGLSAGELLQVRRASPDTDFYDAIENYRRGDALKRDPRVMAKLEDAVGRLDRWWTAAREQELPALLRLILRETEMELFVRALPGGEHRVAVLRALEGFAAVFSGAGQRGVAEFVEYLDALSEREVEPGALVAGGEDAIPIMTVHAAKGLEFPIVFLLNVGGRFNTRSLTDPMYCDESLGLGLKFADYRARGERISAAHPVLKYRRYQREIEEELRLLYVALTRAREKLLIVGHTPPGEWERIRAQYAGHAGPPPLISRWNARNMLEWVLLGVAAGGSDETKENEPSLVQVVVRPASEIKAAPAKKGTPGGVAVDQLPPWTTEDESWLERGQFLIDTPMDARLCKLPALLSVSTAKEAAMRGMATATRGMDENLPTPLIKGPPASLATPAFAKEMPTEPDGRDIGTACHHFLEHADFTRLRSAAEIREQIGALLAAGKLPEAEARLVPVDDVAWLGQTAEGRFLAENAPLWRREVPFVYAWPVGETDGTERTLVRGVMDCLVETDEGLVIFDYKTDAVRDAADLRERVAGYRVQLRMYAQAASEIFNRPVARAALLFIRARKIIEVPIQFPEVI